MSHKTAKCCENCRHHSEFVECKSNYVFCAEWRAWFRREWGAIRDAAAAIKKNNEREASNK